MNRTLRVKAFKVPVRALTRGRKSGKPFVMLICPVDGRHFRGFITSQPYVAEVLARLEGQADPRSSQDTGS